MNCRFPLTKRDKAPKSQKLVSLDYTGLYNTVITNKFILPPPLRYYPVILIIYLDVRACSAAMYVYEPHEPRSFACMCRTGRMRIITHILYIYYIISVLILIAEWLVATCNKRIGLQFNEVREDKRGQQRDQNRWPWQEGTYGTSTSQSA